MAPRGFVGETGPVYYDESARPEDFPAPPSPDEATRAFGGPLFTLVVQPALEEERISVGSQTSNGRLVLEEATCNYVLWRNPADRDDPANLADISDELRAQLDAPPLHPLPEWMTRTVERMRYPWLWDSVRTTRVAAGEDEVWRTPESLLTEHVNYILMNTFREQRVLGEAPGELLGAATERAVEHDVPVRIDGVDVTGIRIDTDAHVLGVGADLGDRVLTAVFPREHLPHFELAFATRPRETPRPQS
jgi:hypothetical protein